MAILGSRAHEALVKVLVMARESTGMTQREVIPHIPEWLVWDQSTLAKIETGRRVVAFEEVQVLAEIYGTDIATIEAQAKAYRAALALPVVAKPASNRKPRKKK